MNLLWLTDIHINFLTERERKRFYEEIRGKSPHAILITGDIAEGTSILFLLEEMATLIQKPIYFVLGNHDYYYSSITKVRQEMVMVTKKEPYLFWLPASGPQKLSNDVVVLGYDCFADGRYGDYAHSPVVLNDSKLIDDFRGKARLGKYALLERMQQCADQDAYDLKCSIEQTLHDHHPRKIIVLMHIPPFVEACMHEGKISNDDYLPFFSSKVTGDVLMQAAKAYQEVEFLAGVYKKLKKYRF